MSGSEDASPQSKSLDVQSDEDDLMQAVKNVRKLSSEEIRVMRDATVAEIDKTDVVVMQAVKAFFDNRMVDCQRLLDDHKRMDPLVMCGSGLIAFLRYALSMEQDMCDAALQDINESSVFASQVMHHGKNVFARNGVSFSLRKGSPESYWLSAGEYRARTIYAESQALRCFVLVLEQNVVSVVKAGLALRRAYKAYTALLNEREERVAAARAKLPADQQHDTTTEPDIGLDRNSIYSVDFGLGAINIALSILPDQVLNMIKILGMKGDQEKGVRLATRCLDSKTLLSPFAGAMLLGLLGTLPMACTLLIDTYGKQVKYVSDVTLSTPELSRSLMHLWLVARAQLIFRNLENPRELMTRCVQLSESGQIKTGMPQLRTFVYYDLSFLHMLRREWAKARQCYEVLSKDSKWSAVFYSYAQACCYEAEATELEDEGGQEELVAKLREKASQQYWHTIHQKATKLGGKVRSTDQIMAKRLDEMLQLAGVAHPNKDYKEQIEVTPMPKGLFLRNPVPLPVCEVFFAFNMTQRMPHDVMMYNVGLIDRTLIREGIVKVAEKASGSAAALTIKEHVDAIEQASASYAAALKKSSSSSSGELPVNFKLMALSGVKACMLSNSEQSDDRAASEKLIDAVLAAPAYKDKGWSLSYVQPMLLYQKACVAYLNASNPDEARDKCSELLSKYDSKYPSTHYYLHSMTEFRVHLAKCMFRNQRHAEKAAEREAEKEAEEGGEHKHGKHHKH